MTARLDQRARRRARRALLQALYQWQVGGAGIAEISHQFGQGEALKKADTDFFHTCLAGITQDVEAIDGLYSGYLDRKVEQLDHVERAVLRAGAQELRDRRDVPFRVVLAEWVSLASQFGAEDGHRYVNGVLDRVARDLRPTEVPGGTVPHPAPDP